MPLYACDLCGLTSVAFRADAAAAHRLEYPDCDSVIRIIFRSDQRSRGPTYASAAGAHAGDRSSQESRAPPDQGGPAITIRERAELDGTLRLSLLGDLGLDSDAWGSPKSCGRRTQIRTGESEQPDEILDKAEQLHCTHRDIASLHELLARLSKDAAPAIEGSFV